MAGKVNLGLNEQELTDLKDFLGRVVRFPDDCAGTLMHTRQWLEMKGHPQDDLDWVREHVAQSDCELLLGVDVTTER